ncbi:PREDICTED: plant-specific TFIIB-related protein PTF2-like [Tarenaya hassleriana]|uniref:plant-specific TFIIB-related protein PTF2-like n=1 Tax=Tarenaya hassleriana TaxID=28532 RepID=UPI00053C6A87|nr:PREDICTED: plant-specific TFIIB-related protein PTF2-like [Tarenaya hassleriana]XP_010557485.1 PREDICTED: plant-specific TFIIB-related protein PTF2-like [Tarenaya hassleriana]
MSCKRCKSRDLVPEKDTGDIICSQCGTIQEFDNYDAQLGGLNGPQGTYIRVGYIGTGSVLAYKDKKIFEANKVIEDITLRLNVSDKCNKIKDWIKDITEGEFGMGSWLEVLVGACSYVVMRTESKNVLPMNEVAAAVGCDLYELGSMIKRVVEHLRLELPEFDLVGLFMRVVNNVRLTGVDREKKEKITEQGVFLMNCSLKWFLSTGRRPLPLVVAVLAIVAEVNGVKIRIEDLAKEAEVVLSTCKRRYRELLEKLVKVAQEGLPWGKDVNMKNVVKHAGSIIGYMEAKSMIKTREGKGGDELVHGGDMDYTSSSSSIPLQKSPFSLEDIVRDNLSKETRRVTDQDDVSQNLEVGGESRNELPHSNNSKDRKISVERLAMMYNKFKDEVLAGERSQRSNRPPKRRGLEMDYSHDHDWWKGKSEMSQRLLLKDALEKNVGLEALPPSYINGCKAVERRREKIKAAKLHIDRIRHPRPDTDTDVETDGGKKRKMGEGCDVDWEDFIIETLVLRGVKDEEIEKGYYKALMDLHVFQSGEV